MTATAQSRSDQPRIGIVAALPGELEPLVSRWERTSNVYRGQVQQEDGSVVSVFASAAGMGPAAATRAFADVSAAAGRLDAVFSYGWAGAISCGVKPAEVYHPSEVIDSRTGERFLTVSPTPNPLRLVTLDHVARGKEKRPLAERYQAVLVDMEAATIARLAQAHGIPFLCAKAISDGYTDVLPDFNRFLDHDGQLKLPAFIAYTALRPRYWAALGRLGVHSKAAARNLSAQWPVHLAACLARQGLLSCEA